MSLRTASPESAYPAPDELRRHLIEYRPTTVLRALSGDIPAPLCVFKAEALLELDRLNQALECLDERKGELEGDRLAEADYLRAVILLRAGWVDQSILDAYHAEAIARDVELKAAALAWSAAGLAAKSCWGIADARLREAIEMAPNASKVLMAQARVRLEGDQRIRAREIYERMREQDSIWAKVHGAWGCSHIAYLLGEFDYAVQLARGILTYSEEIISPWFVIGQVALAREDINLFEEVVTNLAQRSPQAESLGTWQDELSSMQLRIDSAGKGLRKRLEAFPTLVQRRDYCGPSTVELVMRYWKGGAEFSNDQIAERIKSASSGTPMYRMREFFHLVGYNTVRTLVPVEGLRTLIDSGFPVIVQEEFSNTSHVAVVIGYDVVENCIELQDPMTHAVTRTPVDEFNKLRQTYLDGALIAFPRSNKSGNQLRGLGYFDNPALVYCDQAVLQMEHNRFEASIELARKAVKIYPALSLGWVMLCHGLLESWRIERTQSMLLPGRSLPGRKTDIEENVRAKRESFYAALDEAKLYHPNMEFIYQFEGSGALIDKDFPKAVVAFQQAAEIDPENALNYASLAEIFYCSRQLSRGLEAALKAIENAPGLPAANAWFARILASLQEKNAELYARIAVDQNPEWWISHQALAEALLQKGQLQEAKREVDQALSLSPRQPEANILKSVILAHMGEREEAANELLSWLERWQQLDLATIYVVYQALGRIAFENGEYEEVMQHMDHLLSLSPGDPWGLQFHAAAACEYWQQRREGMDSSTVDALQQEYEKAIAANQGNAKIGGEYLTYLEALTDLSTCLSAVNRLQQEYPERGGYYFLKGKLLNRAGSKDAAAACMLEALAKTDGVKNRDELYEAVKVILEIKGLEQTERDLLENSSPKGGASIFERQRALGLALAGSQKSDHERGRELLLLALAADAEDALVMLRLGDISQSEEDRELCYRRALVLDPKWDYARATLANFLIDHNREMEALDFTAGHADESLEVLAAHGRALYGIGHYEEAISALEHAIKMSKAEDASLYVNLWLAQYRGGIFKGSLKTARKGMKLFAHDPGWDVRMAASMRELGDFAGAQMVLDRGIQKGLSQEEALKAEFESAWMLKDYDLAQQHLEELMSISNEDPGDGRLGWIKERYLHLLVTTGNFEQAREFLQAENLSAEGLGEASRSIFMSDDSELTLELAEWALSADPEQYDGLFTKAEALSRQGRETEALAVYHKLMEIYPEQHHAYEKFALRLATSGELEKALEYAERSVELGMFCPYAWATRGLVHFLRGSFVEAQENLQSGWNRADHLRREKMNYFWWILAVLNGDSILADQYRSLTYKEIRTDLDSRIAALIEVVLAN